MRITVEVEVPDGEYCDVASCDFHGIYNSCELFGSNLEKIFIYGTSKCSACLVACQKAEEQKAERDQIIRAGIERNRYCAEHGIPCEPLVYGTEE